jgi:hypothetical protein
MRTIIITILVASCLLACNKNANNTPHPTLIINNTNLVGTWKAVLITGGLGGIHETAAQWGHTETFTFSASNTLSHTLDTAVNNYGSYTLVNDSIYAGKDVYINNAYLITLYAAHDTLVMANAQMLDGTSSWYVKQ